MQQNEPSQIDRKLQGEFAIGVVLLVALIVGGFFWMYNKKIESELNREMATIQQSANAVPKVKKTPATADQNKAEDCKPHYYEGEQQISAWASPGVDVAKDKELMIQIPASEVSKLPASSEVVAKSAETFTVKVIDPTEKLRTKLATATKEKPASFVIQGYAEICQEPPLVSVFSATSAFKKG